MAASEIDDIFTGIASTSSAPLDVRKQGKKAKDAAKKSSRKRAEVADDSVARVGTAAVTTKAAAASSPGKDRVVGEKKRRAETVLDPSSAIEAKVAKKRKAGSSAEKLSEADKDFRDTRGRNRARTEDGYPIYTADELKIDESSGETPLCPFDCDCCH